MDGSHEEFQDGESDARASWHANNVMIWSYVVEYFWFVYFDESYFVSGGRNDGGS